MQWLTPTKQRAVDTQEEGEELQGLLTPDASGGRERGNPNDAYNPQHPAGHLRLGRDDIQARMAHIQPGSLPGDKRQGLSQLDTIDWSRSRADSRRHESEVEARIRRWPVLMRSLFLAYDACQSWVALGIIGASCGVVASIIDTGTDWATDLKFGLCSRGFWISKDICCSDATDMGVCSAWNEFAPPGLFSFVCYVLVAVGMSSYSAWIARLYPFACGSGLPEIKVMMSGFVMDQLLGLGTLVTKSMGLVLAVGAGLSIGKEGPFVHVAMCVAHVWGGVFSKYASNQGRQRELLASAAAAGVAVAFGAPVGGVLFSLEEVVLKCCHTCSRAPARVAGCVLQ
jgi:chloride channel 3/4/5